MMNDTLRGDKTPERFERGTERLTNCPVCGTPIDGLDADARTTVIPCGHSAAQLTTDTMNQGTTSDANRIMTDGGEDMVIVSTSAGRRGNTTYHRDEDCPSVQKMDTTTRKPLTTLAGHYDPCERCHDMVVLASSGSRRRYHRDESCLHVTRSSQPERLPLSTLDDEEPCAFCAVEDADDDRGTIEVCPECDAPQIQSVTGSTHMDPRDHDYFCKVCHAKFDEPTVRPRKRASGDGRSGLAGKLMQADPEDVSADHVDGEPMTDGGVVRWD